MSRLCVGYAKDTNMVKMLDDLNETLSKIAGPRGYTKNDVAAGVDFFGRKERLTDPAGDFDKAGRFYAAERTNSVISVRGPSAAWPYSQMNAARTADHCAEVHGANALHVRRIAKAAAVLVELGERPTAHALMESKGHVLRILKKVNGS